MRGLVRLVGVLTCSWALFAGATGWAAEFELRGGPSLPMGNQFQAFAGGLNLGAGLGFWNGFLGEGTTATGSVGFSRFDSRTVPAVSYNLIQITGGFRYDAVRKGSGKGATNTPALRPYAGLELGVAIDWLGFSTSFTNIISSVGFAVHPSFGLRYDLASDWSVHFQSTAQILFFSRSYVLFVPTLGVRKEF